MEDERLNKIIEGIEVLYSCRVSPFDLIKLINKSPVSDHVE